VFHFPGGLRDYLVETLDGAETYAPSPSPGKVEFAESSARPGSVEWAMSTGRRRATPS
jgi:topoisomerase-4 subunit B